MAETWDPSTRETVKKIPFLTEKAGPRDKEKWQDRLKQVREALRGSGLVPMVLPMVARIHAAWMPVGLGHVTHAWAFACVLSVFRSCMPSSPTSR